MHRTSSIDRVGRKHLSSTAPKKIHTQELRRHNQIQILLLCDLNVDHNEDEQNMTVHISEIPTTSGALNEKRNLRARKYRG